MSPNQFKQEMSKRGFVLQSNGSWTGPLGIIIPGTYNTIDTQGWTDLARNDTIQYVDQQLRARRHKGLGTR
jgi:hypothetical protein